MKGIFNRWMARLLIVLMLCTLAPFQAIAEETYDVVDPEYWEYIRGTLAPNASDEEPATEGVYAILYTDGELVFQANDTPAKGRQYTAIYSVDMSGYASAEEIPWYAKRDSIKTANIASRIAPESVAFWFMNCAGMEAFVGVENLKMHRVTTMRDMFHGCASLKSLELDVNASDRWMTVKVTDMSGLFSGCTALTELNLSVLKTPVLKNLEDAFAGCTGLKKLSLVRWDVSSVTSLRGLFRGCSRLTEVDLTGWDTSRVTDMSEMFFRCSKLATIKASHSFATKWVTGSDDMFLGCRALKGGSGTTYDPSFTDKTYARLDAGAEPGYFSTGVFAILYEDGTLAFQHGDTPEGGRDVKAVFPVEMIDRYVFENKTVNAPWLADAEPYLYRSSIQSVDFVDSISPLKPRYWFYGCSNLRNVLNPENLDLSKATEVNDMFYGCKSLAELDVSSWDTSNISEFHAVFYGCESLTELNVSSWDTSNMTNLSGLFYGCKSLTKLDLSGFDTSKVITFSSMFRDCAKLTELDVSDWNTSSAQQMGAMFEGCTGLTELDLSSWDTAKCFYYSEMFMGDTNLRTIWASDKFVLNRDGVEENYSNRGVNVFTGCTELTGGNGTTYDPSRTDYNFLRIDTAGAPGYFTNRERTLQLSAELPLTQLDEAVDLSDLGDLTALKIKLDNTYPESTNVIFVAAFYDGTGDMLKAFIAKKTVRPSSTTVTIPASGISGAASELRLFALSTNYVPITDPLCFKP